MAKRISKEVRDYMSKLGKLGDPDKKAAATKKRMAALTPKERRELASRAGKASAAKRRKPKA